MKEGRRMAREESKVKEGSVMLSLICTTSDSQCTLLYYNSIHNHSQ